MKRALKILGRINFKTIYFNLKYLPLKDALKFPILVSRHVYLRKMKGKITIDSALQPGMILIGFGKVGIFDNRKSRSIWHVAGDVVFKGTAHIGNGSEISVNENSTLVFGNNFMITAESSIVCSKKIEFKEDCLLSWNILVMDTDFHKIKNDRGEIINAPEEIIIGKNVWIGCKALILKGSIIPDNSVIGADSLVNKKLDKEQCLYAGSPAKSIKENIFWER